MVFSYLHMFPPALLSVHIHTTQHTIVAIMELHMVSPKWSSEFAHVRTCMNFSTSTPHDTVAAPNWPITRRKWLSLLVLLSGSIGCSRTTYVRVCMCVCACVCVMSSAEEASARGALKGGNYLQYTCKQSNTNLHFLFLLPHPICTSGWPAAGT